MDEKSLKSPARKARAATWWKTIVGVFVAVVFLSVVTPWLVGPACPKRVVIATGSDVGAYYAFAQMYQPLLEKEGIQLEVRKTAGSVENARLLSDSESGVAAAIIQGGTAGSKSGEDLANSEIQSLASLFLEPIWVFHRKDVKVERLADLRGKRVVVGAPGSGTRAVALELLADNGLVSKASTEPKVLSDETETSATVLLGLSGREAVDALTGGDADAAFFVLSPTAPAIGELMRDERVELFRLDRTMAYKRRHPYLTSVTVSEGMLDLERNLPHEDIELLAPTAVLVARKDLHPALVPLFLKAASRIHEGGGVLESPREFPSEAHVEYPLNPDARAYLRSGPSFLYRTFPFSVAAWMDRMKLMILPLCTLLIPLIKAAPPLYRWRIRSKIYTWYRVLRQVDQARKQSDGFDDAAPFIEQLKQVERELAEISVPLSFMEEFYNLRWHVAFVLKQLESQPPPDHSPVAALMENTGQSGNSQIQKTSPHIPKAA